MKTDFLSKLQSNAVVDVIGDFDGGGSGSDEIFRVYHSNTPANRALTVLRDFKTGINTDKPLALLHVLNTDTGGAAASGALAILESKTAAYLQLLGWDDSGFQNELGILFGYNGLEDYNSIIYKVTGTYAGAILFKVASSDIMAVGQFDIGILNKLWFKQADKNEFINSINDGYLDQGATTGYRWWFGGQETLRFTATQLRPGPGQHATIDLGDISGPYFFKNVAGMRYVNGTNTLSAAGPTDDHSVSGVNTVWLDTSGGNVTLGGLVGGVIGQKIRILKKSTSNNATIEEAEAHANQKLYTNKGSDHTLTSVRGGWIFECDGSHWYEISTIVEGP